MSARPPAKHPRRPASGWMVLAVVGVLVAVGLGAAGHRYRHLLEPAGAGGPTVFELRHGDPLPVVAERLRAAGLVRNARALRVRARQRDLDQKLQAGSYELNAGQSVDQILDILAAGKVVTRKITFPEGLTVAEAAARAEAAGICTAAEYRRLAENPREDSPGGRPRGAGLEGYLYPDTYHVALTAGAAELIALQTRQFEKVWGEFGGEHPPTRTRHEIVTLASLVEKEARHDDERARIAGVIVNRLRAGQRLELCSTVQYALGTHKERLLERDLRTPSPYNTYLHKGLPPGPICSPGRASLLAALQPAEHDDLFFVLGADGRHVFSRTFAEHRRAKAVAEKGRAAP
ncbi:MAG: endolytic transglycosylase MltG [Armatimonadetes bacterium]|nr:endolytic transglycosylase MltG [Armatimonadota bacterium]